EDLPGDQLWGLEAHLETCPVCRARLAEVAPVRPVVDLVWTRLAADVEPPGVPVHPARHRFGRWLTTWATPATLPWLAMIVLVTLLAVVFDRLEHSVLDVTAVQLFAP